MDRHRLEDKLTRRINGCSRLPGVSWKACVGRITLRGVSRRTGNGGVTTARINRELWTDGHSFENVHGKIVRGSLSGALAGDSELAPRLVTLVDDLGGILLVLSLTREGKLVLGLSIGDLVNPRAHRLSLSTATGGRVHAPEPFIRRTDESGKVVLDILDVVQLGRERIVDIDDDDLPVGLTLIKQSHDTQNLDLLDLADIADLLADLANIQRIVVALSFGLRVGLLGVFPGL